MPPARALAVGTRESQDHEASERHRYPTLSMRALQRCIPPLLAAALVLPFALWQNAWFEWANPLWLLENQSEWVRTHGLPTPYLHAPNQVFYLFHLFYAGGLLGVLAYPTLVLGAWPVFLAATVTAFVVAQQSIAWLARSLGVDRALASVLGLGFVTAPYVVAMLYGRGAWTELVAMAGVTLAVAGAAERLTSGAPRRRALAAVVVGVAVVAATHNLALVFALPLASMTLLIALRVRGTTFAARAVLITLAGAVLGGGLTAVMLFPNLWLSRWTWIAQPGLTSFFLNRLADFHSTTMVLRPWPAVPASEAANSGVYVQTAVPLLLWLTAALVAWRPRRRPSGGALALAALGVVLIVAIVNPTWWLHLPVALQSIQFPFRLVTWLTFVIVVGCALVAGAEPQRPRWLAPSLVGVIGLQAAIALLIAFGTDARALSNSVPLRQDDISAGRVPRSFGAPGYAQPVQFRLTGSEPRPVEQVVAAQRLLDPPDEITLRGREPAGTRLATNVVDSPLVRYEGSARKIGRDNTGFAVLEILPHTGAAWEVTVRPRAPLPVVAGRVVSALSALALIGWMVAAGLRRRRAR
jgi:hypothetical protein